MNTTKVNTSKLYWKYMWYQKGALFLSLILSFFFGLGTLFFTWTLISLVFVYEYHRSTKELNADERFHVLIDTIKQSQTYPPPRLAKTEDVPEELKKYVKDCDSWGEA